MPFSKTKKNHTEAYWTSHWNFLKEKIEDIPGISATRSEASRGDVLRQIIIDLYSAEIVVADLTDLNPNVYWELGVRQSYKNGTVTIAEHRKKIAFDMGMKSILRYYPKDAMKNEEFVKKFKKAIIDCIDNPDVIDSQVLDTLGGRGSIYRIINHEENLRRLDALKSELDFNIASFDEIKTICDDNIQFKNKLKENPEYKEEGKGIKYSSRRLRINCQELLISNRYLEETTDFYSKFEKILSISHRLNEVLNMWPGGTIAFETWYYGNYVESEKNIRQGIELILEVYKRART